MEEYIEPSLSEVLVVSYDGERDGAGRMHGQGQAIMDDGGTYSGGFKEGLFHGRGLYCWADGTKYEGSFSLGMMNGSGKYSWPDGSVYEGGIVSGLRHGSGVFRCSAGQVYEDEWAFGKRNGQGKFTYNEEKTIMFTGNWTDGLRHGFGLMRYATGNTYEGSWAFDKKCGRGIMIWRDVDEVYVGDWEDDCPHGVGEYIWEGTGQVTAAAGPTGAASNSAKAQRHHCNIYRGQFRRGFRDGKGSMFYPNGSQYTGQWFENQKQGEGVFIYPDGKIFCGLFSKDRMDESGSGNSKPANSRASEDVSVQYYINIEDLIGQYWQAGPTNTATIKQMTAESTVKEIERILLRYQSYLKQSYKKLTEISNKRRTKESSEVSFYDGFLNGLSSLEQLQYNGRNFYKRFFCASIFQVKRYLRECDILDGISLNCWQTNLIMESMKTHHRNLALQRQFEYRKSFLQSKSEADANLSESSAGLIFQEGISTADIDSLVNPSIFDGFASSVRSSHSLFSMTSYKSGSEFGDEAFESSVGYNIHSCIFDDPRFPVLDREFVELLIRCIIVSMSARGSTNASVTDFVFKTLAQKVQPLINDISIIPAFVSTFYFDSVQEILRRSASVLKLVSVFDEIISSSKFGSSYKGYVCKVRDFVNYFLNSSTKSCLVSGMVDDRATLDLFLIAARLRPSSSSNNSKSWQTATVLDNFMNFDDFVYHFCSLLTSKLWIFDVAASEAQEAPMEGQAIESLTQAGETESQDQPKPVINSENIFEDETSTLPHDFLSRRLIHFFTPK